MLYKANISEEYSKSLVSNERDSGVHKFGATEYQWWPENSTHPTDSRLTAPPVMALVGTTVPQDIQRVVLWKPGWQRGALGGDVGGLL